MERGGDRNHDVASQSEVFRSLPLSYTRQSHSIPLDGVGLLRFLCLDPLRPMRCFPVVLLTLFVLMAACQSKTDSTPGSPTPDSTATAPAARDTITITGTLIDATCHTRDMAPAECEGKYVAQGYPVGLRPASDGAPVWILVMVPQAVGDYLTTTARVTGIVRSEGVLIPHQMEVKRGSNWRSVM